MHYKLRIGRHIGPRGDRVFLLLVRVNVRGNVGSIVWCQIDQVGRAANISHGAVVKAELAHFGGQLLLEQGRGVVLYAACGILFIVVVDIDPILFGNNTLGDIIQALTCANLVDERGYVFLGIVKDGLNERLQR